VSLLYALEGDKAVREAFEHAVRETMAAAEVNMRTRVRRGGTDYDRVTGNLVAAEFVHTTSRPIGGVPDPHLHAHVVVMNCTYDAEETRWKAAQFGELKAEAAYYQAMFHLALANGLAARGYTTERTATGWEVGGIKREVIETFSRRTRQIEAEAAKRGITDRKAKADLGRRTRESKSKTLPRDVVYAQWQKMAREAGYEQSSREGPQNAINARGAVEFALAKGFERASVLTERRVLTAAMERSFGSSVTLQQLQDYYETRPGLIHRVVDGQSLVTSQEVLAQEKFCLDFARNGINTRAPLKPGEHEFVNQGLSAEQRAAAMHLLHTTNRVAIVNGAAGVGKTQLLQEVIPAIQANGTNVVMLAPTVDASRRVLRSDGFQNADTVARFLVDPAMQHRAKNGVICVDEAGLASVPMMARLFEQAREANARLILIGDTRQHGPVERGDAMRMLQTEAGITPALVRGIKRQQPPEYRQAVQHLADGRTLQGFRALQKMGAVIEIDDTHQRLQALAADYVRALQSNKSVLAISPTHAEGRLVNQHLRARLRQDGFLTGDDRQFERLQRVDWTKAEQRDPTRYQPGMVIQFQRASVGFRPGERATVVGIGDDGKLQVRRDNGATQGLAAETAGSYSVFEKQSLTLAVGDKIRVTDRGMSDRMLGEHAHVPKRGPSRQRNNVRTVLNKGRVLTISGFAEDGGIKTTDGVTLRRDFGHLNHAYVQTSHSSQGSTVDVVLIAESSASWGAISSEQLYVSVSRAREQVRVYCDSAAELQRAIQRSSARQSATELASQPLTMGMAEHLRIRRQL
ncbi:MAG TPA: MobF family relaxase, partial [Phycisphaerales bacterium]|nr:MobF family relaxase [Phycisphaerales bacterium]